MSQCETDLRHELEERLRFETLLADISASFINLPAEQIDSGIEDAQRRVCEHLGLDLSALWQVSADSSRFITMTHLYRPLGGPPFPDRMNSNEYFPWCLQQVENGNIIALSTEEAPAAAARDKEVWLHFGVKSSLVFPLSVGGGPPIGSVSFNTVREERAWPKPLMKQLQMVAQIFANALARKHADRELRESEARLSLATNAAEAGLWVLETDTGHLWVTPKTRELFHFAPDEALSYENFIKVVHSADCEQVNQAVAQARRTGENLKSEYRIVLPDGSIRWIVSSGQRYHRSAGEPDCLMGVSLDISPLKRMENQLHERLKEIEDLKCRLENENLYLRKELRMEQGFEKIVGESKAIQAVIFSARQVAPTDATVLLLGETGTGKGIMASAIHQLQADREHPQSHDKGVPEIRLAWQCQGTGARHRTGRYHHLRALLHHGRAAEFRRARRFSRRTSKESGHRGARAYPEGSP